MNTISMGNSPKNRPPLRPDAIQRDLQAEDFEIDESADVRTQIPFWVTSQPRWEKWWWKKSNKLCIGCRQRCKQSWRVKVYRCYQFEGVA